MARLTKIKNAFSMKNIVSKAKYIPIMVYPYLYLPIFIIFFAIAVGAMSYENDKLADASLQGLLYAMAIYTVAILIYSLFLSIKAIIGKETATSIATMNMAIKIAYLPCYITCTALFMLGMCMGIFGIGFSAIALILSVLIMVASNIYSIGCYIRLRKDKIITTLTCIISIICTLIMFLDIILAIMLKKEEAIVSKYRAQLQEYEQAQQVQMQAQQGQMHI